MMKSEIRRMASRVSVVVACAAGCLWATPLSAQTQPTQASRLHPLGGGFVGRFDMDGAGRTDLFGGQAGIGYGELLQLTGFYWRGFDSSADSVTADRAWGGELQFNLNAGFGITPFITGGLARVRIGDAADQTAAIGGAGLMLPLWRVMLHVAARDYMFGVSGLENDDSPESVTHNWLYSAGVKFALGQRRSDPVVVAAVPSDDRALRSARAELAAVRDSARVAESVRVATARSLSDSSRLESTAVSDAGAASDRSVVSETGMVQRNYQSTERIEIPLPTEGSITLRYGPEQTASTAPLVVSIPGAPAPAAAVASEATAVPPPQGVTLGDPAMQAWIQQQVAFQVAQQLSRTTSGTSALTSAQLDALAQRVLDGVLASVLPRLEAAQARRIDDLRADLRMMLQQQRIASVANVAAEPTGVPQPAAPLTNVAVPAAPVPLAVEPPAPAAAPPVRAEDVAVEAARAEATLRTSLAALVASHPAYLTTRETDRGPAAVVGEAAFGSGTALVSSGARQAIGTVAEALRAQPDRRVYIQGHTDSVGEELSNQRLSELRAEAVRSLLVQEGVAADRLFAIGYGQARPVADNATGQGRAQNRRVEIVIGENRTQAAR